METEVAVWQLALLSGISFLVGILGGLVGLALGTMRLPAMILLLKDFPATTIAGTNILVSTASALTGSYSHLRERRIDIRAGLLMGIPAIVGAFIGGFLQMWLLRASSSVWQVDW